jgi:uncharacterized protein YdeI (YjbR/CyaY-like superfamily)
MKPLFFESPSKLRAWLEKHHAQKNELWVGFHKKHSGKASITWPEAVDALLCFGWIDGIRKSIDEVSYTIRVTPRKSKSKWSLINVRRVPELRKLSLMHANGLKAFERERRKVRMRTNNVTLPNLALVLRSYSGPTNLHGSFFARKRRPIRGPRLGGSSARKKKRPS